MRWRRLPALVMAATQSMAVAMFVVICVRALANPYPLDYGEGVILDQVLGLAAGENVYRTSLATPPYLVTNYPPLFLALQVPFAWLFGPAYWYGRLLSQVGACAAAGLVAAVTWRISRDGAAAFAAGGLVAGAGIFAFWGQFDRVDTFALALGWAGVFLVAGRAIPRVGLAAVFIVAAGFARQTSWMAPLVASCAWLAASARPTEARRLAIFVLAGGVVVAGLLQMLTGGFVMHVMLAASDPWSWSHLRDGIVSTSRQIRPALFLALIGAVLAWFRRSPWAACSCGYVAVAAVDGATAGKAGAYWNYFIELTTGCAMLAGFAVAAARTRPALRAAALLLVALQGLLSTYIFLLYRPLVGEDKRIVLEEMRRTPGAVVSDSHLGLIPLSGHRVYIEPFKLGVMAITGRWDETPFIADLDEHRVELVVAEKTGLGFVNNQFTPRVQAALLRSFQPCLTLPSNEVSGRTYVLYRPSCAPAGKTSGIR